MKCPNVKDSQKYMYKCIVIIHTKEYEWTTILRILLNVVVMVTVLAPPTLGVNGGSLVDAKVLR